MPANAPYPWESPEQFQMRMLQQASQAVPGQAPPPTAMPPAQGGVMGFGAPSAQASTGQLPGQQNSLGMDDAVLGAMLGTYGDEMELDSLEQQLKQAQALRDTAMPQGRQNGRIYTAASPLEFVGAGIKQYQGSKRSKELESSQKETRGRIGKNVSEYGKRVLKKDDEDEE